MSEAFTNARPARGVLLSHMKLKASNDLVIHEQFLERVSSQKVPSQIHQSKVPTCCIACALLLQRLVRAFENRLNTSSDDAKKNKPSTALANRSNPPSTTNGSFVAKRPQSKLTARIKGPRKLPALSVLMQRKVKVTQLVQEAVQFVGSDVLKVLQVCHPSPTVADVANTCLKFLNEESNIKDIYRIFCEASGKDPSSIGESIAIFFGVFALQSLQSLRAQALSAFEFSHDFEMIYGICYQDETFRTCMNELNPTSQSITGSAPKGFAPDTEARNICWKLARLLALKFDHDHKSDPESKDHRRNHILLSASSIILAANIGKSIVNNEISTDAPVSKKQTIPDDVDFVALVAVPVSNLLKFLVKNSSPNQGITPVCDADIRCYVTDICVMINKLEIVEGVINSYVPSSSRSLLSRVLTPANHYAIVRDYRNIIQSIVRETQKELNITTSKSDQAKGCVASAKTGIVNVLLFFPMVIGEPWGIHRDSPMITSRMLCAGDFSKQSSPLKGSVAVVLKMKPRPKLKKRDAAAMEIPHAAFIRTDNKKTKTVALSESAEKTTKKFSQEIIDLVGEDPPSPKPKPPSKVRLGETNTAALDDLVELNEWTLSVLSLSVVKPTDSLLTHLGEHDRARGNGSCLVDVIVPVLNRVLLRIESAIHSSKYQDSGVTTSKLAVGQRDGQVYVSGAVDQSIQLSASVIGFYYYSLEAIIQDQIKRMEFLRSSDSQLQSEPFHRALLACSYSSILKGVGMHENWQLMENKEYITVQVLMDTMETESFTFLKVAEAFCRAHIINKESAQSELKSPLVAGLPVIIHNHIQKIESQLIDSVLWCSRRAADDSPQASFVLTVKTLKSLPGAWPPDILEPLLLEEIEDIEGGSSKVIQTRYKPSFGVSSEANFLSFVLRKVLKCCFYRIRGMCAALNLSIERALQTQILVAFRYLLRHHIAIFTNRHVDQLLLSTIYGVCRVMKIEPKITFRKVIDAYFSVRGEELGGLACRLIVRHVKLTSSETGSQAQPQAVGNIITFYNTVYIPKMQKYFLGSKSLKKSAGLYQLKSKYPTHTEEDATTKVPSTTSGSIESGQGVAFSRTSHTAQLQATPTSFDPGNKKVVRKDMMDASSVEYGAQIGNSTTMNFMRKTSNQNSAKSQAEANEVGPMGNSTERREVNSSPRPSVVANRIVTST